MGVWITVSSDERIKENITEVPDNLALQILRNIDCNYYEYKKIKLMKLHNKQLDL